MSGDTSVTEEESWPQSPAERILQRWRGREYTEPLHPFTIAVLGLFAFVTLAIAGSAVAAAQVNAGLHWNLLVIAQEGSDFLLVVALLVGTAVLWYVDQHGLGIREVTWRRLAGWGLGLAVIVAVCAAIGAVEALALHQSGTPAPFSQQLLQVSGALEQAYVVIRFAASLAGAFAAFAITLSILRSGPRSDDDDLGPVSR